MSLPFLLRASMPAAAALVAPALVRSSSQPRAVPPHASVATHVPSVLFVECGMGADQHGQDATKACVRACRNAIEFNSLPSMRQLIPGGYDGMRLHVQLDGNLKIAVEPGGLLADSGVALEAMGDKNQDWIIAVACVTVGFVGEFVERPPS